MLICLFVCDDMMLLICKTVLHNLNEITKFRDAAKYFTGKGN